jgi:post-segregation antitoxin (ccd killing protein)
VVPRNKGYWIEAIERDGPRRMTERYDTEDEAVARLNIFKEKAGIFMPKHGGPLK